MARRVLLILTISSALLILLLAFVFWSGSKPVVADPIQRQIEPWATTPKGLVDVHLRLQSDQLPSCGQSQRPLDAILVIDRSDSMGSSNALRQAADSAVAFAQILQEQVHRVGTVVFDNTAQPFTPLGTSAGDLRIQMANLTPGGGTNIADGLAQAGAMLIDNGRPDASQVIVLLSDGGAQEPDAALQVAQSLKNQGVYIVTVGLPGGDFSPDLLRELATTPNDFYQTDAPGLPEIYQGLAHNLRSAVASDVLIKQPYAVDRFTVDPGSIQPATGSVVSDTLQWRLPVLGEQGIALSYALRPASIGWHDVAGTLGETTMIDCTGALLALPLAPGPKVLVSPLPPLLWLLLPFLFFVPLFLISRRGKPVLPLRSGPEALNFDFSEKPAPFAWLDDLSVMESHGRTPPPIDYTDAFVIGVGRSGRSILAELRRMLCEQTGGKMPGQIRLLSIDTQMDKAVSVDRAIDGLETDEILKLEPNLDEVARRLENHDPGWAHLRWWGDHTPDDPGRAGARMALFYDLMLGEGQSTVWKALRKRLDGLSKPLVYVVGSLADPSESGLVLDLPHFIRQATEELGTGARRVIAVLLLQHAGARILADNDAGRHTYASVRELQRILLRERFAFEYNPRSGGRQLVGSTVTTPIDACYLVDGKSASMDLGSVAEEDALYPSVADALLTLLSSSVAIWHQDYINKLPGIASRVEEETGRPTVSSLGSSVVLYPLAGLKAVVSSRFLLDLIFGGADGRAPLGLARLDPGRQPRVLEARAGLDGLDPMQRAVAFLKTGGEPNRHPVMRSVAEVLENTRVDEDVLASLQPGDYRIDQAFRWALRDELLRLLNGGGGSVIANRSGKLGGALAFLSALAELLKTAEFEAPRRLVLVKQPQLRPDMTTRIANWRRTVENTLAEARQWETILVGTPTQAMPETSQPRRQRSGVQPSVSPASLFASLSGQLSTAQAYLQQIGRSPLRTLVGDDVASQEALYQRYLGPERLKSPGLRPLEEALSRIGWWALVDGEQDLVRLRLIIVPPETSGPALNRYSLGFSPNQLGDIEEALARLANSFLPLLDQERISTHVRSMQVTGLAQTLLKGADPLVTYVRTFISQVGGTVSRHLVLTLSDAELRKDISDEMKRSYDLPDVEAQPADNPYRSALVGLTDVIPIESLEAVEEASLDYASDTLAQIFPAEQRAAQLESEWRLRRGFDRRLHPRFVRLLENSEMARMLTLADLYGLVTRSREGMDERVALAFSAPDGPVVAEITSGASVSSFQILYAGYDLWLTAAPTHPLSRARWSATRTALETAIKMERRKFDDLYTFAEARRDETDQRLRNDEEQRRSDDPAKARPPWEQDVDAYLWLLAEAEKRAAME